MQTLSLFNTDFIAGYGLSQALELAVRIPLRVVHAEVDFVDAAGERLDGFESIHHRNETLVGLGDLAWNFAIAPCSKAHHSRFVLT